jgi:hypothetical protein
MKWLSKLWTIYVLSWREVWGSIRDLGQVSWIERDWDAIEAARLHRSTSVQQAHSESEIRDNGIASSHRRVSH